MKTQQARDLWAFMVVARLPMLNPLVLTVSVNWNFSNSKDVARPAAPFRVQVVKVGSFLLCSIR